MKRIGGALLWFTGAYFVGRAVLEPFVIDLNDPSTYQHDWGGPTLMGVLLVHCGLGVVAAGLMAWRLMRRSSRRLHKTVDRPVPPSDDDSGRVLVGAGLPRQQERRQPRLESHAQTLLEHGQARGGGLALGLSQNANGTSGSSSATRSGKQARTATAGR